MSNRFPIVICVLSTACIIPLQAQSHDDEEGKLNFSAGGGLSVPLNPIARFSGVGGAFAGGAGYNIDQHNSIIGQFNWDGLPPNVGALAQLNGGSASVNLYNITADYKYRGNFSKAFGFYMFAGGGWFYRHSAISKSTFIPAETPCQPIWSWYGYTCSDGFVNTVGVSAGTSSAGANGGIGLTIKVKNSPWKFFVESRYIYAASRAVATQVAPVIFGFEYQ